MFTVESDLRILYHFAEWVSMMSDVDDSKTISVDALLLLTPSF